MNRLETKLSRLRENGERALAPYVTAGDGGVEVTLGVLRALDTAGVACVELGLPFSDPIADGPILQAAAERALKDGMNFERLLEILLRLRRGDAGARPSELPIVVMTYANLIVRRGWSEAARSLAEAGADALLVADLPIEEGLPLAGAARESGLAPIFFVSPTTDDGRMQRAIELSRGFVYAIGRFGVTGASTALDEGAQSFLSRVRAAAGELPVAVGFGIGDADHVRAAVRHADLAIVGSALVDHIHRMRTRARDDRAPAAGVEAAAAAARTFVRDLSRGLTP